MNGSGSKTFKELFLYPKGRKTKIQETMDKVFGRVIEKKDVVRELPARLSERPPRALEQPVDQDWTDVWPTAQTYRSTVVPLPIRMGYFKPNQAPPKAYGNLELMKIPNFLHLTPKHIQKHCEALKKFCTKFPEELKDRAVQIKYFPVQLHYSDYVHQGTNIRDTRSREVTIDVHVKALNFDTHGHNKFRQLAGDRYNKEKGRLCVVSNRCPTRKQNRDYSLYLLNALYHESIKTEEWEKTFAQELLGRKEIERRSREHDDLMSTGMLMIEEEEATASSRSSKD